MWFICFKNKEDLNKFKLPKKEELKITVKDILEKNVDEKYYLTQEQIKKIQNRSRFGDHLYYNYPKIWHTLCAIGKSDAGYIQEENNRIRIITPKEAFRLMGFLNDEININNIKDYQLYKLAGNGWDINLVSKIFKNMLEVFE